MRIILDAGALIALERNDRSFWLRFIRARQEGTKLLTHAGILGQVWRRPDRQVSLARALPSIVVQSLTPELARQAGRLLAATGTADVHDSALASMCRPGDVIFTSDQDDLELLVAYRGVAGIGILRV